MLKAQSTELVLEGLPLEEVHVLNASLPHFHRLQSLLLVRCSVSDDALKQLISTLSPKLLQLQMRPFTQQPRLRFPCFGGFRLLCFGGFRLLGFGASLGRMLLRC